MKATLKFTLPDEAAEFNLAITAQAMACVIADVDDYLRRRLKYEDLPKKVAVALQDARDELRRSCGSHGADAWEDS